MSDTPQISLDLQQRARRVRRDALMIKLFVGVLIAATLAAFVWFETHARADLLRRAEDQTTMLAVSLAQHAHDSLEIADTLLSSVADRVLVSDRSPQDLFMIGDNLARRLNQAWRVRSVEVFDASGRRIVSSQLQVVDWSDVTALENFTAARDTISSALHVGPLVTSRSSGEALVPVSRRITAPDGSFFGVAIATLRSAYFRGFHEAIDGRPGTSISLVDGDNIILSRAPMQAEALGRDMTDYLRSIGVGAEAAGIVHVHSPIDGISRIYSYRGMDDYPLRVFVGTELRPILVEWVSAAVPRAVVIGALVLLILRFGYGVLKGLREQQRFETGTMHLARTDGLTGLLNRRAFDESLSDALRKGRAGGPGPALIMLDVDHFKQFNDRYGHPEGDEALRRIASVMKSVAGRDAAEVARLGGEEFAVLLPKAALAQAHGLAERIRTGVLAQAIAHAGNSAAPHLTVSLGLAACRVSEDNVAAAAADLLRRADAALYDAKARGRNQVSCCATSLDDVVPLVLRRSA